MVGILIVSHSKKAAEGIFELAVQMAGKDHRIVAVGGMEDGSIGTDSMRICQGIQDANDGDGVVILADLGSGIMSSQVAIDLLEEDIEVDVCIIGGGLTGLTTAYYLSKTDLKVALVEKERLCEHTSRKYNR